MNNNNNPDSSDFSKETSFQGLCPPPSTMNVARDNETSSRPHPSINIARVPADDNQTRRPPPVAGDLDESCPRPPPPQNIPAAANETRPHPRPNVPAAANETRPHPHPRPNLNVPGASETHEKPKKKKKKEEKKEKKEKKKRKIREIIVGGEMTTLRLGCDPNMQFEVGSTSKKPKPKPKIPDLNAPLLDCPCVTCSSKFVSIKALFGHMRCHPDRGWRGIIPPEERRRRRKQRKHVTASADPQGSGLGRVDVNQDDQEVARGLLMLANGLLSSMDEGSLETVDSENHRYECSSCKRVFGSHQALGGHRASHKKVKGCFAITAMNTDDDSNNENRNNEDDSNGIGSYDPKGKGKAKVTDEQGIVSGGHRCGICGKLFASGQALGGHMRCHWDRVDQNSSSSSMMFQPQQQQLGGILFNPSTAGCSTSYANRGEWDGPGSTGFALDLNVSEPAEPEPEPAPVPVEDANGTEDSSTSSTPSSEMDLDLKLGF